MIKLVKVTVFCSKVHVHVNLIRIWYQPRLCPFNFYILQTWVQETSRLTISISLILHIQPLYCLSLFKVQGIMNIPDNILLWMAGLSKGPGVEKSCEYVPVVRSQKKGKTNELGTEFQIVWIWIWSYFVTTMTGLLNKRSYTSMLLHVYTL